MDRLTTGNTKCEHTMDRLVDTNCPRPESTPGEGDASYRSIDETYEVRCRPMIHNVDRLTTKNTKYELTAESLVDTNCPQLESTPGEGYASYRSIDKTYEERCRPMIHNIGRLTTGNTKCEMTTERSGNTNFPRLESTPGEGDASYRSTDWSAEGHTSGRTFSVSVMNWLPCVVALLPTDKLYATIQRNDTPVCIEIDSPADIDDAVIEMGDEPILRRRLPRTEVFAEGVEEKCMAPCTDSRSTIQNPWANPWRRVVFTEQDMRGSTVKGVFTVTEPCDLLRRRRSWPPKRGGTEGGASVRAHIALVRLTNFLPNENAGGRNDDYIWLPSESDHPYRQWSLPPNTAATKVGGLVHEHLPLFRRTKFPPNRSVVSLYRYRKFVRRPDPTPEVCAAGRNGGYIRSNRGTVPSVCNEPVTGSQAHGSSHRLGRCDLVWSAIPSFGMGSATVLLILLHPLMVDSDDLKVVTLLFLPPRMQSRSGDNMIRPFFWILHVVRTLYDQITEVNSYILAFIYMISTFVFCASFFLLIEQFIRSHRSLFFRLMLTFAYCLHRILRDQTFQTDRIPLTDITALLCKLWISWPSMSVGSLRNDKSGSADLLTSAMNGSQPRIHDGIPETTDQTVTLQTILPPLFEDTEQQCRQLQEIRMCRTSESRQPRLSTNLSTTSFTLIPPIPESSSSLSPVDRSQPLHRESLRPSGDAGLSTLPHVAASLP